MSKAQIVQRLSLNILFLMLATCTKPTQRAFGGTTYYVDDDGAVGSTVCSTGNPCPLIATAIAKATQPDDIVEIRDGTYNQCGINPNSGTSGHPIVIRSANDLGAVWKCTTAGVSSLVGPMGIKDRSYITIGQVGHGIDFNGSTTEGMIDIWAATVSITDITIQNNSIRNNGNVGCMAVQGGDDTAPCPNAANFSRQIYNRTAGNSGLTFNALNVTNNVFDGNYGFGIYYTGVSNSTTSGNTDRNRKSSQSQKDNGFNWLARFFHFGRGSNNNLVTNNTIENWVKDSITGHCPVNSASTAVPKALWPCNYSPNPIRADVNSDNNRIESNIIRNINYAKGSVNSQAGIEVESGCDDNLMSYNQLYRLGGVAIQLGSYQTNIGSRNTAAWNSIFDCGCGVIAAHNQNYTVKNNIVHSGTSSLAATIQSDNSTVGAIWKNNNWYNENTANIGLTGATSGSCVAGNKNLSAWASAVGETGQIGGDPRYVNISAGSEDLNLQSGSPSIHAADDGSNQGFSPLANPPPFATITVLYPNGGEDLVVGNSIPITWLTQQSGNCSVELNRGVVWETLSGSTTCTSQSMLWTVTAPGMVSTAIVRVTSLSSPTTTDTSDGPANIHGSEVGASH